MKRDFTTETLNELTAFAQDETDSKSSGNLFQNLWGNIKDAFSDLFTFLGDIDADSSADDIEKYHKTYIDEKDFAVSEIKKVFEDAIDIDASFSDKTEDILEDLKALI